MHPAVALVLQNAQNHSHLLAPLALVVSSAIAQAHGPVQHQLLVACVSWGFIWIFAVLRAGLRTGDSEQKRVKGWLAGGFLALAAICDRAACDREGIWSTKGFLPLVVVLLSENHVLSQYLSLPAHAPADTVPESGLASERSQSRSYRLLAVIVVAASIVLATSFTASPTSALGLSSVIFTVTGLVIFESASRITNNGGNGRTGLMSANGSFSRRASDDSVQNEQHMTVLRDVAAAMTVACTVATFMMEPTIRPEAVTWVPLYHKLPKDWKELQQHSSVQQIVLMVVVNVIVNVLMFTMASLISPFFFSCNVANLIVIGCPAGRCLHVFLVSILSRLCKITPNRLFLWHMVHHHLCLIHHALSVRVFFVICRYSQLNPTQKGHLWRHGDFGRPRSSPTCVQDTSILHHPSSGFCILCISSEKFARARSHGSRSRSSGCAAGRVSREGASRYD